MAKRGRAKVRITLELLEKIIGTGMRCSRAKEPLRHLRIENIAFLPEQPHLAEFLISSPDLPQCEETPLIEREFITLRGCIDAVDCEELCKEDVS